MHVLYIYGGADNKEITISDDDTVSLYRLNLGSIINPNVCSINDGILLSNIAKENIKDYSEFIYRQNKKFIAQDLIFDNKLSLYFLSDFSCKRSEFFSTYSDYCSAILIRNFILNNDIDRIVVDSTSFEFYTTMKSISSGIQCNSINLNVQKNKLFNYSIKHIIFYSKTFISVLLSSFFDKSLKVNNIKIDELFLTRYPLHLNDKMQEDKYGELAKEKSFLVGIITDGFHQKVGVIDYLNYFKFLSSSSNVYILDRYLKSLDVIKSFFSIFNILKKFQKLFKERYIVNGIDMSSYIYNELEFSMFRIPRILMWERPLSRFIECHDISSFYYYLHEYTYGRVFTYSFKYKSPDTHLIGFQHGPASNSKLLYMTANIELLNSKNAINSFPVPDEVFAEDRHSASIYTSSGYVNVAVMKKIYRLSYLKNIDRSDPIPNLFLIAPGLHDGEFLIKSLADMILKNKQCQFILKTHPRGDNRYVENFSYLKNLKIEGAGIEKILSKVSKVYVTYSSLAIEAVILGIDVKIVDIPGKINETPLNDGEFLQCIENINY